MLKRAPIEKLNREKLRTKTSSNGYQQKLAKLVSRKAVHRGPKQFAENEKSASRPRKKLGRDCQSILRKDVMRLRASEERGAAQREAA